VNQWNFQLQPLDRTVSEKEKRPCYGVVRGSDEEDNSEHVVPFKPSISHIPTYATSSTNPCGNLPLQSMPQHDMLHVPADFAALLAC
jgi:hypothetical protein